MIKLFIKGERNPSRVSAVTSIVSWQHDNYSRLAVRSPTQALFLFLSHVLEILPTLQSTFSKLAFFLSLGHNFDMFTHHVPLIDKSCNTTTMGSGYTFAIGGSYLLDVSHPPDKSCTRVQAWHLVLLITSL